MNEILYRGRQARILGNRELEIVVTVEGGHIAAVRDKESQTNPLWSPPWPSIEPSAYDSRRHPEYGGDSESKLLAGILGHNLCLDLFGVPSEAEAAAGMTVHGEASVVAHDISVHGDTLVQNALLPQSQLRFRRSIQLPASARVATIRESIENLSAWDRPIAWTQHATIGPPFLEKGRTQFRANARRSKVIERDFTGGKSYMALGAEFDWPMVPCQSGGLEDLQVFTGRPVSAGYSAHLMDPAQELAWFLAWSSSRQLAFGYVWRRLDFPWLGIWEENGASAPPPWNGQTLARGMEFGVSPFPESRRAMVERGPLFGAPTCKWLPARRQVNVEYRVFLVHAAEAPERPPI